jgi:hypothetical protein
MRADDVPTIVPKLKMVGTARFPHHPSQHDAASYERNGGHAIGRAFARPMALPTLRNRLT